MTWTQRSSRWWKARRGDTWTQNLLRWQDQEPIPQTIYKLVLTNLWIQVFLDITCSHQWSPIQSANACRLKFLACKSEDKSEWIELDSTSEYKLLWRKDLYSKVCQYKTLRTVHRIDSLSILGNTYNNLTGCGAAMFKCTTESTTDKKPLAVWTFLIPLGSCWNLLPRHYSLTQSRERQVEQPLGSRWLVLIHLQQHSM